MIDTKAVNLNIKMLALAAIACCAVAIYGVTIGSYYSALCWFLGAVIILADIKSHKELL